MVTCAKSDCQGWSHDGATSRRFSLRSATQLSHARYSNDRRGLHDAHVSSTLFDRVSSRLSAAAATRRMRLLPPAENAARFHICWWRVWTEWSVCYKSVVRRLIIHRVMGGWHRRCLWCRCCCCCQPRWFPCSGKPLPVVMSPPSYDATKLPVMYASEGSCSFFSDISLLSTHLSHPGLFLSGNYSDVT